MQMVESRRRWCDKGLSSLPVGLDEVAGADCACATPAAPAVQVHLQVIRATGMGAGVRHWGPMTQSRNRGNQTITRIAAEKCASAAAAAERVMGLGGGWPRNRPSLRC